MEPGRIHVIVACLLALVVGFGGSTTYAHYHRSSQLDPERIAQHPYMGASVLVDDEGQVLDAIDHSAAGLKLSQQLDALTTAAIMASACRQQQIDGFAVRVCPIDPAAHELQGSLAQPVSIDVDGSRVPTANQLTMIAGKSNVRSVEIQAGHLPMLVTMDGKRIPAVMYAPPTAQLVRQLATRPGCARRKQLVICR